MPEILSAPRSAGGTKRGGTVSSAPRSAGGSSSRGGTVTSAPRGIPSGAVAGRSGLDVAIGPGHRASSLTNNPINFVLRASTIPALGVGEIIAHPFDRKTWTESGIDLFKSKTAQAPGQALRSRGALDFIPDKYGLRGIAAFVGDVVGDPFTYATAGGSGALRAASKAGAEHLLASAAASKAGRVTLADVAKAGAVREVNLASHPRALSVGFRVPFTRGKVIPLAESESLAAVGKRVSSAIGNTRAGETLREVFLPAGAGSKAAHRIGSDTRRFGETEKRLITRAAVEFQKQVEKTAKSVGMKTDDAYQALVRSLDQPDKYPVPKALSGLRDDAAKMLDDMRALEDQAGVERGLVPDYVPHLPANAAEANKLRKLFPLDPGRKQFFQQARELQNLDQWHAIGLKPEYNLARLLEVRGYASVDARVMKAFDDAVADVPGIDATDVMRVKEQIRPSMSGSAEIAAAKNFINQVGSSWKGLALLSPGYHMRNLQGDMLSAYWAGARNPASFVQAVRLLRGRGSITIAGKKYTAEEFTNLAEAAGAIRLGQVGKEIRAEQVAVGGVKHTRRGPSRPGRGKIASASQAVGSGREDMVRLGTFIERMKAGDDVMSAAQRTRDYLYDYGDVGKFVGAARRFWLPFVTFPVKATAMVGRQLAQHPGTIATVAKAEAALNQAGGSPDLSLLSPGAKASFAIPAPSFIRSAIGAPEGQPLLFNPESVLAYGALNALDPTNPVRSLGGLLNPIPKSAIEAKTGFSFYFDSPSGKRVVAPAVINLLAKHGVPVKGYGMKRVSYPPGSPDVPGYSRALDSFLRLLPLFGQTAPLIPGGGSEATRLPYLKYFGGLSISPYDAARAQYYANKYGGR